MTEPLHLSDGALLALIDDPSTVDREAEAHLSACPACRARRGELVAVARRVAGFFAEDDAIALPAPGGAPTARAVRPGRALRAAAVVALLALVGLGPLRAAVVGWVREVAGTGVEVGRGPYEVSFEAPGPGLVIDVPAGAPRSLSVTVEDRAGAVVVLVGATARDVVTVAPDRVTVTLGAQGAVDVRVSLPASITRPTLVVAGVEVVPTWAPSADVLPRSWTVEPAR